MVKSSADFDFIVAGVGGSGLQLVEHFLESQLQESRILLTDVQKDKVKGNTWCFWQEQDDSELKTVISHRWKKLAIHTHGGSVVRDLGKYEYCLVRGYDYHNHIWNKVGQHPNIVFQEGRVTQFGQEDQLPFAQVGTDKYNAKWILNSCQWTTSVSAMQKQDYFLWQHFEGWWIESEHSVFDPQVVTFMDFRTEQENEVRFFYILPIDENKALVEMTALTLSAPKPSGYAVAIEHYIKEVLGITNYTIERTEKGAIPMTTASFPAHPAKNVINVGTVGGCVKPSTGFAFMNCRKQAKGIVQRLEAGKQLQPNNAISGRFRFYDRLLLHILTYYPGKAPEIFYQLFKNNDA